jgi:sensor histidine kinase YesM
LADPEGPPRNLLLDICLLWQVSALGLLLTHASRNLIRRWGWCDKSWLALAPRILGLAVVVSLLWSGIGFTLHYLVTPAGTLTTKLSLPVLFALSTINGVVLLIGWYSAYFFYQIFDRYNRSEIERLRLAAVVKETELRALKSQVNPHFIFNSLNSVRALIDEDPARARQAVTQLANLLRYSLQSGQLEVVPFEDELAVVNDYLALEQVRHEERLRLRLEVAPETLHLPVPPMVLQTLVENAIKYGIAPRPEGGEITIRSRVEDDVLHLAVANPGRLAVAAASPRAGASTGVGLRNADARLRLLFGDRATLRLRQSTPDLVVAEVRLPLLPEDRPAVVSVPRESRRPAVGSVLPTPTL